MRSTPAIVAICGALAFLLAAAHAAWADPLVINTRPVSLHPDKPSVNRVGRLIYRGGLRLTSIDLRFGGVSGLTFVGEDRLLAVSDRGWWISFRIVEKNRRLVGVRDATIKPLRDDEGKPIGRISDRDAEAVEIAADGSLIVSFERRHRLWRYPRPPGHARAKARELRGPAAWSKLPLNGGLEAIAPLEGGGLLMVAERSRLKNGDLAAWLRLEGRYHPVRYATEGRFLPTDLARLGNGDLLVLERRFANVGGFATRVQIIDRKRLRPGARLTGREIARLERPLLIENFEGAAVRTLPGGATILYLVSDNNYSWLQRTLLLSFELMPP